MTKTVIADALTGGIANGSSFFIGGRPGGNHPQYFAGRMDGVRIWDDVRSATEIADNITNTRSFLIGGHPNSSYEQNIDGTLDDVRVWSVVRTAADIADNLDTELSGTESGLQAVWDFNCGVCDADNSGETTAYDGSVNGYDATLEGLALSGTSSNWVCASP